MYSSSMGQSLGDTVQLLPESVGVFGFFRVSGSVRFPQFTGLLLGCSEVGARDAGYSSCHGQFGPRVLLPSFLGSLEVWPGQISLDLCVLKTILTHVQVGNSVLCCFSARGVGY